MLIVGLVDGPLARLVPGHVEFVAGENVAWIGDIVSLLVLVLSLRSLYIYIERER